MRIKYYNETDGNTLMTVASLANATTVQEDNEFFIGCLLKDNSAIVKIICPSKETCDKIIDELFDTDKCNLIKYSGVHVEEFLIAHNDSDCECGVPTEEIPEIDFSEYLS